MYDEDKGTVKSALQNSSSAVFTDDTISKILALTTNENDSVVSIESVLSNATGNVTNPAGVDVVMLRSSWGPMVVGGGASAVTLLQGNSGANVTFNNVGGSATERMIVGSGGADQITINDAIDSHVIAGHGDTVVAGLGESTIVGGMGDTTIEGGSGHAIVQLSGDTSDFTVAVENGHAVVTGNGSTTDITGIQYVQLDNGKALVFAEDSNQAAVTTLYETTFGRTADAGGLQYWFDQAAAGTSLQEIASAFTQSSEFTATSGALDNEDFVQALYQNTFGRDAEADGLAYWVAALETGGATRAQLIAAFADIASQNIDGSIHTEATVVGSVTIVHNIV